MAQYGRMNACVLCGSSPCECAEVSGPQTCAKCFIDPCECPPTTGVDVTRERICKSCWAYEKLGHRGDCKGEWVS